MASQTSRDGSRDREKARLSARLQRAQAAQLVLSSLDPKPSTSVKFGAPIHMPKTGDEIQKRCQSMFGPLQGAIRHLNETIGVIDQPMTPASPMVKHRPSFPHLGAKNSSHGRPDKTSSNHLNGVVKSGHQAAPKVGHSSTAGEDRHTVHSEDRSNPRESDPRRGRPVATTASISTLSTTPTTVTTATKHSTTPTKPSQLSSAKQTTPTNQRIPTPSPATSNRSKQSSAAEAQHHRSSVSSSSTHKSASSPFTDPNLSPRSRPTCGGMNKRRPHLEITKNKDEDGPGFEDNMDIDVMIQEMTSIRTPVTAIHTPRKEENRFQFLSPNKEGPVQSALARGAQEAPRKPGVTVKHSGRKVSDGSSQKDGVPGGAELAKSSEVHATDEKSRKHSSSSVHKFPGRHRSEASMKLSDTSGSSSSGSSSDSGDSDSDSSSSEDEAPKEDRKEEVTRDEAPDHTDQSWSLSNFKPTDILPWMATEKEGSPVPNMYEGASLEMDSALSDAINEDDIFMPSISPTIHEFLSPVSDIASKSQPGIDSRRNGTISSASPVLKNRTGGMASKNISASMPDAESASESSDESDAHNEDGKNSQESDSESDDEGLENHKQDTVGLAARNSFHSEKSSVEYVQEVTNKSTAKTSTVEKAKKSASVVSGKVDHNIVASKPATTDARSAANRSTSKCASQDKPASVPVTTPLVAKEQVSPVHTSDNKKPSVKRTKSGGSGSATPQEGRPMGPQQYKYNSTKTTSVTKRKTQQSPKSKATISSSSSDSSSSSSNSSSSDLSSDSSSDSDSEGETKRLTFSVPVKTNVGRTVSPPAGRSPRKEALVATALEQDTVTRKPASRNVSSVSLELDSFITDLPLPVSPIGPANNDQCPDLLAPHGALDPSLPVCTNPGISYNSSVPSIMVRLQGHVIDKFIKQRKGKLSSRSLACSPDKSQIKSCSLDISIPSPTSSANHDTATKASHGSPVPPKLVLSQPCDSVDSLTTATVKDEPRTSLYNVGYTLKDSASPPVPAVEPMDKADQDISVKLEVPDKSDLAEVTTTATLASKQTAKPPKSKAHAKSESDAVLAQIFNRTDKKPMSTIPKRPPQEDLPSFRKKSRIDGKQRPEPESSNGSSQARETPQDDTGWASSRSDDDHWSTTSNSASSSQRDSDRRRSTKRKASEERDSERDRSRRGADRDRHRDDRPRDRDRDRESWDRRQEKLARHDLDAPVLSNGTLDRDSDNYSAFNTPPRGHQSVADQWSHLATVRTDFQPYHRLEQGEEEPLDRRKSRRTVQPIPNPLESAEVYLQEAQRLKHEAEGNSLSRVSKLLTYLEAVLSFVQCGAAMENEPSNTNFFQMYKQTVKFCRDILKGNRHEHIDSTECKLTVLCFRLQSLLCQKLFKLKKAEAQKLKRIMDDYYRSTAAKPATTTQAPSPYQSGTTPASRPRTTGTPSPMSPQPSPAGSVTSVGSVGSVSSDHVVPKLNGTTPGSTPGPGATAGSTSVAVPSRIHSVTQLYLTHMDYLYQCHQVWDDADHLAHKHKDFFRELDQDCGRLTLHSSLLETVRYVKEGIHRLRELLPKVS